MPTPEIVRVIERLDRRRYRSPEDRLAEFDFAAIDLARSVCRPVDAGNYRAAIARHTGPHDVPAPTPIGIAQVEEALAAGVELVQYELEATFDEAEILRPIEPGELVLGPWHTAEALGLSRKQIADAMAAGEVEVVYSRRVGRVDRFILLDGLFDEFAADLRPTIAGADISPTRWFTRDDVAQAIRRGDVVGTIGPPLPFANPLSAASVEGGARWARWIASRQPADELERIRRRQVAAAER